VFSSSVVIRAWVVDVFVLALSIVHRVCVVELGPLHLLAGVLAAAVFSDWVGWWWLWNKGCDIPTSHYQPQL